MLLSNQQKYILEILKEFKYLRVRQLHALVQAHYHVSYTPLTLPTTGLV